jgi:hypothetical protein
MAISARQMQGAAGSLTFAQAVEVEQAVQPRFNCLPEELAHLTWQDIKMRAIVTQTTVLILILAHSISTASAAVDRNYTRLYQDTPPVVVDSTLNCERPAVQLCRWLNGHRVCVWAPSDNC